MSSFDHSELIQVPFASKIVTLKIGIFDTDVDTDDLLKIDYSNIMGEILTFPVLLNRIGSLRAEAMDMVANAKMDFAIFEAQLKEEKRRNGVKTQTDAKGVEKAVRLTADEVEGAVLTDPRWKVKKLDLLAREKNFQYIDSLYWAAKSKDDKLNKLSHSLKPEEFEQDILEGAVNGILIKCSQPLIK
jgi:hypothetical protein